MRKILSVLTAASIALAFGGCGKKEMPKQEKTEAATNVTVAAAEKKTVENTVTYTGEIKASESTSVSAKASGQATAVYKELGDYVKVGDILLKIDETDYRTQYNQAQASYNQAQATLKSARAAYGQAEAAYNSAVASYKSTTNGSAQQSKTQLEAALSSAKIAFNDAEANYNRQKALYDSGAISKSVYDAAVTAYENAKLSLNTAQKNYDLTVGVVLEESKVNAQSGVDSAKAAMNSAQAQIESAQAAVSAAQVGIDSAKNNLNNTVVRAPISGYIASRSANKGQMVAQGVEVYAIKATSTIDAEINVTEAIIPYVTVGTKASVAVKTIGKDDIEGTVTTVSPVKDAQTGMYKVSVAIANKDGELKDGMFADITLTIEASVNALTVPSEALLEDEDGTKYVYVANGKKAEKKEVQTGIATDEYTEIVSGISEGESVVLSGKEYLSEKNNAIKIVE